MRRRVYVGFIAVICSFLAISCNQEQVNQNATDKSRAPTVGFNQIGRFDLTKSPTQDVFVSDKNVNVELVASRGKTAVARVELAVEGSETRVDDQSPFEFSVDFPASDFPNGGRVKLSAVAIDQLGNRSKVTSQEVIIDTLPPVVTNFKVLLNNVQQSNLSQPLSIIQGGTATIRSAVRDPVNDVEDPDAGTSATTIVLRVDSTVALVGSNGSLDAVLRTKAGSIAANAVFLEPGTHTLNVDAVDGAGNIKVISEFAVQVVEAVQNDNTPPTVTLTSPQKLKIYRANSDIDVVASATDPESSISSVKAFLGKDALTLNNQAAQDATYRFSGKTPVVPQGTLEKIDITVTAVNGAAVRASASASTTIVLDELPPSLQVDALSPGSGERRAQRITGFSIDQKVQQDSNIVDRATNVRLIRIGVYRGDIVSPQEDKLVTEIFTTPREDNNNNDLIDNREGFFEAEWDPSGQPYGVYTLFVDAEDIVGNNTSDSSQTRRTIVGFFDTTEPTATMRTPDEGATFANQVPLLVEVFDNADTQDDEGNINTSQGVQRARFFISGREGQAYNAEFEATQLDNPRRFSTSPVSLLPGKYRVYAVVVDAAGNEAESNRVDFTVVSSDTSDPVPVFVGPSNGARLESIPVNITLNSTDEGSGVRQIVVQARKTGVSAVDIGTINDTSGEFPWAPSSGGEYELIATATDGAGNTGSTSITVDVVLEADDDTAPTVTVQTPSNRDVVSGIFTLRGTVVENETDLATLKVSDNGNLLFTRAIDAGATVYSVDAIDTHTLSDGQHVYRVEITNTAGLSGTAEVTVNVDNTAPEVSWRAPNADAVLASSETLQIRVSDANGVDLSTIEFFINDQLISGTVNDDGSGLYSQVIDTDALGLSNGTYTLKVVVQDKAGNVASAVRQAIIPDRSAPSITISQPVKSTPPVKVRGQLTLQVKVEENETDIAQVLVFDNGGLIASQTEFGDQGNLSVITVDNIDTTQVADGQHIYRVEVLNKAGLSGQDSIVVDVDNTKPSLTWIKPAIGDTLTGQVALEVRATDSSGLDVDSVTFLIGDERLTALLTNSGDIFTQEIDTSALGLPDNNYVLKAIVTDKVGNSSVAERAVIISNKDTAKPTVVWVKPLNGSTVKGVTSLEVEARDLDNNGNPSTIESVKIYAGSQEIGSAINTVNNIWRVQWPTFDYADGAYTLRAVATDASGNLNEEEKINVTVANALPLEVALDASSIEPEAQYPPDNATCTAEFEGQQLPCYGRSISIPVSVQDETGTASVTLIVQSAALGTAPLGTDNAAPYVFTLDTLNYPNNDVLNIVARVDRVSDNRTITSGAANIGIYNQFPLPTIAITSPSEGDTLQGLIDVSMNISQPSPTAYSMDLTANDTVSTSDTCGLDAQGEPRREGFLVQFVDFTNSVIAEQRVDARIDPLRSGTYKTSEPFRTIDLSNDVYTIRLTAVLRNIETTVLEDGTLRPCAELAASDFETLTQTIQVTTENNNKIPPSLVITQPVNTPGASNPVYRDGNGLVFVTVSDNVGLAYVELRVFSEQDDDNTTPSRYDCNLDGAFNAELALPLLADGNTYLPNQKNYRVRVIAQDADGNRTQQEIVVDIDRTHTSGELFAIDIQKDGRSIDEIGANTIYTVQSLSDGVDHTYSFFELTEGSCYGEPQKNGVASTRNAIDDSKKQAGRYTYSAQIIDNLGNIYRTNDDTIVVKQ